MSNSVVTLTIEKAEALLALNPGGTSNPYITASIGAQSVTTPVQSKTVNPIFNATFTFQDCPLPSIITLRVFNKIQYVDVEDPLGTATITVFELQPEEATKVVQLSHGGNAALAQRAANGCGSVTIRYAVTPMPAAPTSQPASPAMASSKNGSIASASGVSTPMRVPAAINIDGTAPAAIPVAISPKESHMHTPRSASQAASASNPTALVASNPSTTNPAATTPNLRPVEASGSASQGGAAAVGPVFASSSAFGVSNAQNSQLTPPSLSPARPPAVSTFLIPQVAPPPPSTAGLNVSLNASPNNGYISYVVPGVRTPAPVEETSPAPLPSHGSAEAYYANNNAISQPASTPKQRQSEPSPSSAAMLPVATNAPTAVSYASLHASLNAATSSSLDAQKNASSSSLYTSAAQAPALVAQQKLLVVPPHIHGTPSPTFFHASAAPSQEGSRLPSAAQLPASMTAGADAFPAHAPPAPEAGATAVAVAPRTQPLSSSTTNSRRTTPATLSSHGRPSSMDEGFPAHAPLSAPVVRRGITAAAGGPATAHVHPKASSSSSSAAAAFPCPMHPTRYPATAVLVGSTTSPKRRSPKNEASADAALPSAEALYADADYLFEAAASGADLGIFRQLREADPCLTNGFVRCLDYSGRSLLHIAAWNGQLRVLQVLLAPEPAAPMLDLRGLVAAKSGNTILHAAACGGQVEVAQWLRYTHPSAGPLLLPMRNARGMTAAECAMEAGFPQVARLLIPN